MTYGDVDYQNEAALRSRDEISDRAPDGRYLYEEDRLDDDWPVHRPAAPDAPIPGTHHYASCDPDMPRVSPDGICQGCGALACPDCGKDAPCDCDVAL